MKTLAIATAFFLWGVGAAQAVNPPALTSVGHNGGRHLTASWTLPANVEVWGIRIATSPETGSDGEFFTENRVYVEGDVGLDDTSYLSTGTLAAGTYFVMVVGYDNACFVGAGECGLVRSNITPVVIPNKRPAIQVLRWAIHGHGYRWSYYVEVHARVRVCDDYNESGRLVIQERTWIRKITFARSQNSSYLTLKTGCRIESVSWRVREKFYGVGNYTVRLWAVDAEGAKSNVASRNWFTND